MNCIIIVFKGYNIRIYSFIHFKNSNSI